MKSCALALLFVTTCWGVPLEQYTPDKSDWSTFYSKPLEKNTDHTPDGINWIAREDWKEWDGTVYNATEYSKEDFAELICPGRNTIRGMRELFQKHKPFADNMLPTKAEVDNWHAIALNHVRAMVGYTEEKYQIKPDKCLHLRALWCTERASSRLWDTDKYPGTCLGSTQPHCGADFLPTKEDQQPYLPEGIEYCPKRAGSEGLFSAAKSDIPWSLKWARPLCWTLAVEGFWGGHTGPWFHRSEFGWDWTDPEPSNLNSNAGLRAKWSGTSAPNKYISSDVTSGRNLVKVEGVNPYPRFKNVECVDIDWVTINNAANATKCYELMTENDNCGKRFMTFNPNNSGCGCYPPESSTCVATYGANRLTWDFSPRVPSFAGLFIDPEKKLSRNALPYDGRECPNINWKTDAGDPMHCLQKIIEGNFEDCGRKFITWNVINFGCACYPPSVETCTRSESNGKSGRQTFELDVDPSFFTNAPTVMKSSSKPSSMPSLPRSLSASPSVSRSFLPTANTADECLFPLVNSVYCPLHDVSDLVAATNDEAKTFGSLVVPKEGGSTEATLEAGYDYLYNETGNPYNNFKTYPSYTVVKSETLMRYYEYYGPDYAPNDVVKAALKMKVMEFPDSPALTQDFTEDVRTQDHYINEESAKKINQYTTALLEMYQLMEKSVQKVKDGCISYVNKDSGEVPCQEAVDFWDNAAAVQDGPNYLGTKRCQNYLTCGWDYINDDEGDPKVPNIAIANQKVLNLFQVGQNAIRTGDIVGAKGIIKLIQSAQLVSYIQGVSRYAQKISAAEDSCLAAENKEYAEGMAFATGMLPQLYKCNRSAAKTVDKTFQLRVGNCFESTIEDFLGVLRAEYQCLGITCEDVGGLWDEDGKAYYTGAEPCVSAYGNYVVS